MLTLCASAWICKCEYKVEICWINQSRHLNIVCVCAFMEQLSSCCDTFYLRSHLAFLRAYKAPWFYRFLQVSNNVYLEDTSEKTCYNTSISQKCWVTTDACTRAIVWTMQKASQQDALIVTELLRLISGFLKLTTQSILLRHMTPGCRLIGAALAD